MGSSGLAATHGGNTFRAHRLAGQRRGGMTGNDGHDDQYPGGNGEMQIDPAGQTGRKPERAEQMTEARSP